jgi:glycosyltransferase involved in cell wall biosynthesis
MDRIYVVNQQAADRYRARFPTAAERIHFLPNWADPTIFHPVDDQERTRLRGLVQAELGLPSAGGTLLYAGRLEGQKDPLLLARAFAMLRRDDGDLRLIVAGEGALEESLRRELGALDSLGATHLVGTVPRDRLAQLMQASDLLVLTSEFETGPTVGLEALASGLPVATTRVGEVARLVEQHRAGAVASERSPEAVAEAIRSTLDADSAGQRAAALAAAAPHLADRVLGTLYDDNRALAARL